MRVWWGGVRPLRWYDGLRGGRSLVGEVGWLSLVRGWCRVLGGTAGAPEGDIPGVVQPVSAHPVLSGVSPWAVSCRRLVAEARTCSAASFFATPR